MPYKDKEKQRLYQREWARNIPLEVKRSGSSARRQRNRLIIQKAKSVPCTDCKNVYPTYVMDLDHLPDFKKLDQVGRVGHAYGSKKVLEEISKCEVVCANCHRIRTHKRKFDKPTTNI